MPEGLQGGLSILSNILSSLFLRLCLYLSLIIMKNYPSSVNSPILDIFEFLFE